MTQPSTLDGATRARLLLVLLGFAWGLTWPAIRIALDEVSPWSMRTMGFAFGLAFLLLCAAAQRRSLRVERGRDWLHLLIASLLNVVGFGVFSTFAMLSASTSRVIIVAYSMPVWASILAWLVLREQIGMRALIGLGLCVLGLTVLVAPIMGGDSLTGFWLALGCALSWAGGTVYMKWARIRGDLVAIAAWQIALGTAVMFVLMLIMQGPPSFEPLSTRTWIAIAFAGLSGSGLAYLLWFTIISQLPTSTASLGALSNPVIGIIGSVILLGDRPTLADITGFGLIFAAAACVLIQPGHRPPPEKR